jgi:putative ABC transport system permease protein
MLFKTAICIILHEKTKFLGAVVGVALAVFLVLLQWGFYFGYKRDTSVVLDAFDADIWIVPKGQTTFDGFTSIDDLAYSKAKDLPAVQKAARVVWGIAPFRHLVNGAAQRVQILGVEFESGIGVNLAAGSADLASMVRPDGCILVGKKSQRQLGVYQKCVDGVEIHGRRASVVGFVENVHLFTTLGFVVTGLDNARAFLGLSPSHVTYIVCKCQPGADVQAVAAHLRARIPEDDVLTSHEFRDLNFRNWETKTGIGPLLLFPSILAGLVGFLMVTLTFYISTIQKLPLYASLKAIGAATSELVFVLLFQVASVFLLGSAVAAACLWPVLVALRSTTIAVLITPNLVLGGCGALLLSSAFGSLLSVRRVATTDPGKAFRT